MVWKGVGLGLDLKKGKRRIGSVHGHRQQDHILTWHLDLNSVLREMPLHRHAAQQPGRDLIPDELHALIRPGEWFLGILRRRHSHLIFGFYLLWMSGNSRRRL